MKHHALLVGSGSSPDILARMEPTLNLLLRQRGYRLHTVRNDADAFTWAKEHSPRVIVLASRRLCRDLKINHETANFAVIGLPSRDIGHTLHIEPDAVLYERLTPGTILAAIDRALAAQAARHRQGILVELSIWLPSAPGELESLCEFMPAWLQGCGLTIFQIRQMNMALREIVANSIEWGHRYDRARLVNVLCRLDAEQVSLLVRDTGPGFDRNNLPHAARPGDPLSHLPIRSALQLREGGFGILMASGLVDHLCYNDTGNEGLLVKYLPSRSTLSMLRAQTEALTSPVAP
jgi:anti-sigma regulatory factor (Ser/Thr protein kinase)